jgi:hypothetical protein
MKKFWLFNYFITFYSLVVILLSTYRDYYFFPHNSWISQFYNLISLGGGTILLCFVSDVIQLGLILFLMLFNKRERKPINYIYSSILFGLFVAKLFALGLIMLFFTTPN